MMRKTILTAGLTISLLTVFGAQTIRHQSEQVRLNAAIPISRNTVVALERVTTSTKESEQLRIPGKDYYKDAFVVVRGDHEQIEEPDVLGDQDDNDLIYKKHLVELPLFAGDHYYGKHINAAAATRELNRIPILEPGDHVEVINQGYLTMHSSMGYVRPPYAGFLYASGVCWSTSTLGTLMDEVNKEFALEYGEPLFVFSAYDRLPHNHAYTTYKDSNYGFGYTVVKSVWGGGTDYKFTVNPKLSEFPQFKNLRLKIVMSASEDHENAYLGHSIEAHIRTNIDF